MRPVHLADLDKARPVLVLTREIVRPYLDWVTVAPITRTVRGLSTELAVGVENGLDGPSVVSLDNVTTIEANRLGRLVGYLLPAQEGALTEVIATAFDLE